MDIDRSRQEACSNDRILILSVSYGFQSLVFMSLSVLLLKNSRGLVFNQGSRLVILIVLFSTDCQARERGFLPSMAIDLGESLRP